jgi:hypothetical protein
MRPREEGTPDGLLAHIAPFGWAPVAPDGDDVWPPNRLPVHGERKQKSLLARGRIFLFESLVTH